MEANGIQWRALLALADAWQRPKFPLTGESVKAAGVPEGPLIGRILGEVEDWWIDSDAAWSARFAARRLMAHVEDGAEAADALRAALEDAEKSFTGLRRRVPKENWENPYASMMFVVTKATGLDVLWFGDCGALVKRPDGAVEIVGDAFAKRTAEARRVKMLAEAKGLAPASGTNRPEFLSALRAARNTVTSEKGGWLFGPASKAADHVRSVNLATPSGTIV